MISSTTYWFPSQVAFLWLLNTLKYYYADTSNAANVYNDAVMWKAKFRQDTIKVCMQPYLKTWNCNQIESCKSKNTSSYLQAHPEAPLQIQTKLFGQPSLVVFLEILKHKELLLQIITNLPFLTCQFILTDMNQHFRFLIYFFISKYLQKNIILAFPQPNFTLDKSFKIRFYLSRFLR